MEVLGVKEISEIIKNTEAEALPSVLKPFEKDERASVKRLVLSGYKRYNKHLDELMRLREMSRFEADAYAQGHTYIAGVDEAGRGPLAGPVVTAAVILKRGALIEGVNDSKKLSEKKREELYDIIMKEAVSVSVAMEDHKVIDEINILNATKKAMTRAVLSLDPLPDLVLTDAVKLDEIEIEQKNIIKGDAKSITVAAASIIAKVTRDRLMLKEAEKYPEYGFESNKGYGTAGHIAVIKELGLCPIHRKTFTKGFI